MNFRRLLLIAGTGVVTLVLLALAGSAYWKHQQTPFRNAPKLLSALQAFSRDQTAGGRVLPPEVSLQDLVRGGYLTTHDVHAFEGMEVTFSTDADESRPQMILARAKTREGQVICLLADGSVQQFTTSRVKEALDDSRSREREANLARSVGLEINSQSTTTNSGH